MADTQIGFEIKAGRLEKVAAFFGITMILAAGTLNLLWNVNSLSSLDTRMNTTCVTYLGTSSGDPGNILRQEMFNNVFGARFSSWLVFGIQAAICIGGIISYMLAKTGDTSRSAASKMFVMSYSLMIVMMALYGVLLGFAFNNGVAYAWERSDGHCAGSYKNSNSQAGIMLASALLAGMFSLLHVIFVPMADGSVARDIANMARNKNGLSPMKFLNSHFMYILSTAFFLGAFVIINLLWFRLTPNVTDDIKACGNISHTPVPPDWLLGVGENTDANGHSMVLGIAIVAWVYLAISILSIVLEYRVIDLDSGGTTAKHLSDWLTTNKVVGSIRLAAIFLIIVMWGRLLYIGNSNWLPQIFDDIRGVTGIDTCTANNDFNGPLIWIGFALAIFATIFHESFRWSNILKPASNITSVGAQIHPFMYHLIKSTDSNPGARARFGALA